MANKEDISPTVKSDSDNIPGLLDIEDDSDA
jgi:hypothetical protein